MENPLSLVKARHLKDARISNLSKLLEQNPPQHLQVQGLIGSQLAFFGFRPPISNQKHHCIALFGQRRSCFFAK
jgi:hypothetical protein